MFCFAENQSQLGVEIQNMATSFDQQLLANLPATRRYARALIGDTELANEAVVHAITRLSKISLPWIPEKLIRLWLVHFVNEYSDKLQSESKPSEDGDNEPVEIRPFDLPASESAGGSGQLIDKVDAMLQALTEKQRRIYLLLAVESFAIANVALLLSQPVDTIQTEFESIKAQLAPTQDAPSLDDDAAPLPKAA